MIDALINRGLSGGPVVAIRGNVPTYDLVGIISSVPTEKKFVLTPGTSEENFNYMLESVYQACLALELRSRGLEVETEPRLPVIYKGQTVSKDGFRIDMVVADQIVVELKSVEKVQPVHLKQLLTYLRLAKKPLGLLINFNE